MYLQTYNKLKNYRTLGVLGRAVKARFNSVRYTMSYLNLKIFVFTVLLSISAVDYAFARCDENSSSVAFARSLSSIQLVRLYEAYEVYINSKAPEGQVYRLHDIRNPRKYPKGFEVIKSGVIKPRYGRITLEGCFDSFVIMHFTSLGLVASKEKKIVLGWGEGPSNSGSEILWQQ